MKIFNTTLRAIFIAAFLFASNLLNAQLEQVINKQGKYTLVADGCGTNNVSCDIFIEKPTGATTVDEVWVVLGVADYSTPPIPGTTPVTFNGSITPTLGSLAGKSRYGNATSNFSALFNAAAAGSIITLSSAEVNTTQVEGVGVIVIWNDPTAPETLISLSLGSQRTDFGSSIFINTNAPMNTSAPGFSAIAGYAINFSFEGQPIQRSVANVNGTVVTTDLGASDDGSTSNGTLWTIGGYGDSPTNLSDELIDITPAILNGSDFVVFGTSSAHPADWINAIYLYALGVPLAGDMDGDGIADVDEGIGEESAPCFPVQSSGYTGYDLANATWAMADCDGDGVSNGDEVNAGTDPYDACDPDTANSACVNCDAGTAAPQFGN